MTARQKFWLKVVLAVTFPLWALPALVLGAVAVMGLLVWQMVSDLVDQPPRRDNFPGPR